MANKKITELSAAGTLDGTEVTPVVQGAATVKALLSALPVSTPQQTALNLKAPLASPTFTGNPLAPTPSPGDNDTSVSTTAFVSLAITAHAAAVDPHGDRAYADSLFAANDALVYKGVISASSNPNYPAASAGHVYKISTAGKIGGASGINVEIGDSILCTVDGSASGTQAAVGANWSIIQTNIDGAVVGPASSVSGNVAMFSGTSGKIIADSGAVLGAHTAVFGQPGAVSVVVGKGRQIFGAAATILDVRVAIDTAPTGATVLVDVNKNGSTIFSTQGNRPSIAIGANASGAAVPDVTALAAGDYLTVDIDQVGSTVTGSDLVAVVRYLGG